LTFLLQFYCHQLLWITSFISYLFRMHIPYFNLSKFFWKFWINVPFIFERLLMYLCLFQMIKILFVLLHNMNSLLLNFWFFPWRELQGMFNTWCIVMTPWKFEKNHYEKKGCWALHDAPSNSLKNLNVNPKVKTMEEGFGVCFFVFSTSGVKKVC